MTKQKPLVVRTERLPHRHAVVRVRAAYRQLQQMQVKTELADKKQHDKEQIVQEKKT